MPRYDDDQCEMLKDDISVKNQIIKELKRELKDRSKHLDAALRYGFEKNQENMVLKDRITELLTEIVRG